MPLPGPGPVPPLACPACDTHSVPSCNTSGRVKNYDERRGQERGDLEKLLVSVDIRFRIFAYQAASHMSHEIN